MNIRRVTYLTLGVSIFAASCSKEAAEPDIYDWADGEIYFKTSLAAVEGSRGQDMTLDGLETFQATCFNTGDLDSEGNLEPSFEKATFIRQEDSHFATYVSSPAEGPRDWPANSKILTFFAYNPSADILTGNDSPGFSNSSTGSDNSVSIVYSLPGIKINADISEQFDFVTAEASGERWKDFAGGVDLAFRHQLCQVELRAWGASEDYDFEIAGVRIGNPVVEGDFIFADGTDAASSARWHEAEQPVMDKVEYTFTGPGVSATEGQTTEGDRIIRIGRTQHNTSRSAASLMGRGGCAMLIPTVNERWEAPENPGTVEMPYSTDGMYFSILLRVAEHESGKAAYPYPGNPNGMKVVCYATDKDGKIIQRLYKRADDGIYCTDTECRQPYDTPDGIEIKEYGWAAVPVDADWKAGKRYVYTLDYTEGIGLHDPEDPEPGKPIVGQSAITWSVSVSEWEYADKDANYDPDVDVPN